MWKHEALDFTPWLSKNLDVLEETIDLEFSDAETEQDAGKFSVDILTKDNRGRTVVIENQYGATDHDHLGKLLTYLSVVDASVAVWIAEKPRPEHVQAIAWLNESENADFYLVKIEAVRIGDSPPAPLLTLIVGSSQEAKDAGTAKKVLDRNQSRVFRFLQGLLDAAAPRTALHQNVRVSTNQWVETSRDVPGSLSYFVRKHDSQAELYIWLGKDRTTDTEALYDELLKEKAVIEEEFGFPLEWDRLDGKQACRIRSLVDCGYSTDEDQWPDAYNKLIDRMIALDRVLRPRWKKAQSVLEI